MTVYSYSRVNTFKKCPLEYKLHYIDGIKTEKESIEAFMGTRIHETLEKLYADHILSKNNRVEDLLEFYNKMWVKKWHDNVFIVKEGMTPEYYKNAGEKAINDYYAHYHPFDQSRTLWTEKTVRFNLDDDNYCFTGKIDRLDRASEGFLEIHDYKGSGRLPEQKYMDQDKQLALYQIAVKEAFPDTEMIVLVWHFVLFDTEIRSARIQKDLDELKAEFRGLVDEIESAEDFPSKESALCNWCGYWEHCPIKKHFVKIDELPIVDRKKEKGYVLVDNYMELTEKKKQIEKEIEDVKSDLIEYAKLNEVEVVRGTEKRARISIKTVKSFPSKREDENKYEEIIQLIKEAGIWDKVSMLNSPKLLKDFNEDILPKDLKNKLGSYVYDDEKARIYPGKVNCQPVNGLALYRVDQAPNC